MVRPKQLSPTAPGIWPKISDHSASRPTASRARRDRHRADHGDRHSRQPEQSRSGRVSGLRRLGSVEDCAKIVEIPSTDLSDYLTAAVIPIDGGLVRG